MMDKTNNSLKFEQNSHYMSGPSTSEMIPNQQVQLKRGRSRILTKAESDIINTIDSCFRNWYEPWKKTYLLNEHKFEKIYNIMEDMLHRESLIRDSDIPLTIEKTDRFANIIATSVDLGNALLDIDMIIRANGKTSREIDVSSVTTIELFKAHLLSHNWRETLLIDYFNKDRPNSISDNKNISYNGFDYDLSTTSPTIINQQQQRQHLSPQPIETSNRSSISPRASISSSTGILNATPDITNTTNYVSGRRTPQNVLPTIPNANQMNYQLNRQHPMSSSSSSSSAIETLNKQIEIEPMIAIITSEAFLTNEKTRLTILPELLDKIENLIPSSTQQIENCIELLGTLLSCIEKLPIEYRKTEVLMIAKKLLKSIIKKIYIDELDKYKEFKHASWTTFLISIIKLMDCEDFENYLRSFNNSADLAAFINDYLHLIQQLMSSSTSSNNKNSKSPNMELENKDKLWKIFPFHWIEMTLLACTTFLNSLTYLYKILRQNFRTNVLVWSRFIQCLLSFMIQDTLKPNRLMLKERHRRLADDLTQKCAEYVWISWDSMNQVQDQKQFIEEIIEPLIEACMILKTKQRQVLLPIFYDMMRYDYTCQYITQRSNSIYSGSASSTTSTIRTSTTIQSATKVNNFNINVDLIDTYPINDYDQQQQQRIITSNDYIDHSTFDLPAINNNNNNNNLKLSQSNNNSNQQHHGGCNLMIPTNRQQIIHDNDEELPYLKTEYSEAKSDDGTVLTNFTHLIVGKLNKLMIEDKRNLGDELFKDELCAAISGDLNPKYYNINNFLESNDINQFKSMARHTSDLISEFMQICLDYRQANKLSYRHLYLLCTFKLILFFRDKVDIQELYIKYLFTLSSIHHGADRSVEAAYTLLELANKLVPWSEKTIDNQLRFLKIKFKLQTNDNISLKIALYDTIMDLFNKGQLWEEAIPLCRKLIDIYQFETFEYDKLAIVLQKMAQYFNNIATLSQVRDIPEYFRVSFYGNGFIKSLRDKTVVYRGKPFERLTDFNSTILSKYPDATLWTKMTKPNEDDLNNSDARYIQISKCTPIVDLQSKFGDKNLAKMQESLLVYYKYNECDKFSYDRRISSPYKHIGLMNNNQKSNDDVGNMWLERTTISTNRLPGLLPFFEVYLTETSLVSPIESAIECMERRNEQLSCLINRFKADRRHLEDVRILDSLISGTIDAAVNGGISKYEEAFFTTYQQPVAMIGVASTSTSTLGSSSSRSTTLESNFAKQLNVSSENNGNLTTELNTKNNNKQQNVNTNFLEVPPPPIAFAGQNENNSTNNTAGNIRGNVNYHQPNAILVDKLKCLIAQQVPLLEDALKLQRDRISDDMRGKHEYMEESYKKLTQHIMTKYSRYLPPEFGKSTKTSSRSLTRSPNRSIRLESKLQTNCGNMSTTNIGNVYNSNSITRVGRLSEDGNRSTQIQKNITPTTSQQQQQANNYMIDVKEKYNSDNTSKIRYRQFDSERRSLPFLPDSSPTHSSLSSISSSSSLLQPPPPPPPNFNTNEEKNILIEYSQQNSSSLTQSNTTILDANRGAASQAQNTQTPDSGLDVYSSQNFLDTSLNNKQNNQPNIIKKTLFKPQLADHCHSEINNANEQVNVVVVDDDDDNDEGDDEDDQDDYSDNNVSGDNSIIERDQRNRKNTNSNNTNNNNNDNNNDFPNQLYTRLLSTTPTPPIIDDCNREKKKTTSPNCSNNFGESNSVMVLNNREQQQEEMENNNQESMILDKADEGDLVLI